MKRATKTIHNIVTKLKIDAVLATWSKNIPVLVKLIPTNLEYPEEKTSLVYRDHVRFKLQLSDYMQWHVYANLPEPLWVYARRLLGNECVVFDIGANIGAFSLKTASWLQRQGINCQIHAFEPNRHVIDNFKENLDLNPELRNNITIIPLAISDKRGKIYFDTNPTNSGAGKISATPTTYEIEAITLDEYIYQSELNHIDLIKIDVEGNEPQVLNGGQEVIRKHKPMLILEITDEWFRSMGSSAADVFKFLEHMKYKLFSDIGGRVQPFDHEAGSYLPFQYNVLAINEEKTR